MPLYWSADRPQMCDHVMAFGWKCAMIPSEWYLVQIWQQHKYPSTTQVCNWTMRSFQPSSQHDEPGGFLMEFPAVSSHTTLSPPTPWFQTPTEDQKNGLLDAFQKRGLALYKYIARIDLDEKVVTLTISLRGWGVFIRFTPLLTPITPGG